MERNLTNIKERILYLTEYYEVSKESFFTEIGMTYGNFKGESKNRALNSDAIERILTVCPDISAEWLVSGKGNMLKHTEVPVIAEVAEEPEAYISTETKTISDRVKAVLMHFDENAERVGNITGKASNTIRNIANGKTTDVRASTLISLLKMFPRVDGRWLLTGAGSMIINAKSYKDEHAHSMAAEPNPKYGCPECHLKDGEIKWLKEYNQKLSEKSDKQQEEIGKLKQQIEELQGRGNNRNSKQAV